MKSIRDGKEIILVWVPGLVGMKEVIAADFAKDAHGRDISDELIPFSDLKHVCE